MRKRKIFRPTLVEKLEDRTVPSSFGHGIADRASLGFGGGNGGGNGNLLNTISNLFGGGGFGDGDDFGGGGSRFGGSNGTPLNAASRDVSAAIQTFDNTVVVPAEHALQTALSSSATSATALSTFNSTITTGVAGLNTAINTALAKDLPNSYTTVETSITGTGGLTSTLQSELIAAASPDTTTLTNAGYLALNRQIQGDVRSIANQATQDLRADAPTGVISSSTLQTFNRAVRSAYSAFNLAISNAEQTSISGGSALDSNAVSTAVTSLQSALTTAVGTLPAAFQSSASNTTAAAISGLSGLTTTLDSLKNPTLGSNSSARLFLRSVSSAVSAAESTVNLAINTSLQNYNNSLY